MNDVIQDRCDLGQKIVWFVNKDCKDHHWFQNGYNKVILKQQQVGAFYQ